MGEQGAESIHAHLVKLENMYRGGMPNDVARLKYVVKEQMLESAPSLTNLRPPPKKRKKESDSEDSSSEDSESYSEDSDSDEEET